MKAARTFDGLIDAARRARASAIHICRHAEHDAVHARLPAGLIFMQHVPRDAGWFERALASPGAAEMAGRVVIAIKGDVTTGNALGMLGMPERMAHSIAALDIQPGGLIVVASPDAKARQVVMTALGSPGETRHVPWIEPARDDIEIAGRMDCDAMLIDGVADRGTASQVADIVHSGCRVIVGLNATDTIGAIARLRKLRIERHMLGSALRAVIAVRPASGLCPRCRLSDQTSTSESALLGVDQGTVIFRAAGCGACDGTGFGPPVMVFESIVMDGPLRRLLAEGADVTVIARHAFLKAPTIAASARALAREGAIPVETAIAVAREDAGLAGNGLSHPHILSSAAQWLDDPASPPLSARLRGDRSSIG